MTKHIPLRERTVSRFGLALVDEIEKAGSLATYLSKIRVSKTTLIGWVENKTKPDYVRAMRLLDVSPDLREHLEERGSLTPKRKTAYAGGAQTSEQRKERRAAAQAAADKRIAKIERLPAIRAAARKINARVRKAKKHRADELQSARRAHYAPGNRNYVEHLSEIEAGNADVTTTDSYQMEES